MTTKRSHLCYHHVTIERTTTSPWSKLATPRPTGRNIGVIFDTEMSMVSHVEHVCCISYYHLRNIASIRTCLTQKDAVRLVYSLVISRIDYANCLLYDLTQCLIFKLQRVQNAAARLVVRCHRCEHITPVLMKLHWHPVKKRGLLVFRAQNRQAPPYITDLLERYGDRMFSVAGPRLWNSLAAEMKKTCCLVIFKRLLKTHLFRAVYEV